MSDENPFGIISPIPEDDSAGRRARDETPPPRQLAKEFMMTASVGWVKEYVSRHQQWCPALRVLRRWAIVACVLLGVVVTLNSLGILFAKTTLKETTRAAVLDVLREHGLLHSQNAPESLGALGVIP